MQRHRAVTGGISQGCRPLWLLLGAVLAVLAWHFAGELSFPDGVDRSAPRWAIGVSVFIVTCWLTQALPLGVASLLPLVLFPLFGVHSTAHVAASYAHPILWLFFGGFILALMIERWDLHRRVALRVLARVGPRPRRLVLGFAFTGLFLSLWISNTATSLMLLPIGWALVDRVREAGLLEAKASRNFAICIMLGIAYGCSVGGLGTPIGTAPNALFFANYDSLVERGAPSLSFLQWLLAMAPLGALLGLVIWWLLTAWIYPIPKAPMAADDLLREARSLPPMSTAQRRVIALFLLAVAGWLTRGGVDLGGIAVPGWASLLVPEGESSGFIADGTVAVGVALLAFLVPAGTGDGRCLMDWEGTRRLPYEILFLLGAGIAIAGAFKSTGVSAVVGEALAPVIGGTHPFLAVLVIAGGVTLLTEFASNTAITSLILPMLMAGALEAGVDPRIVMLPATVAASCAFMFPIATPPNAVVFSSGHVTFGQMARAGVVMNLVAIVLIAVWMWVWVFPILGIDPGTAPGWMR